MLLFVAYLNSFFFGYFCNTTQIHVGVGGLNNSAVLSEHVCFQGALDSLKHFTQVLCVSDDMRMCFAVSFTSVKQIL